jgi:Tfp pilus assembly protein PilO
VKIGGNRLALFASALIVLAGYLAVFRPCEAQIAERYAQLDDGQRVLDERLASSRRSTNLRAEEHRLETWLARTGARSNRTTVVNHFLQTVASTARIDRIVVTAIIADGPIQRSEGTGGGELPLSLSLRGTYRDILRLVGDLDRTTLAARIGLETLENAQRDRRVDPDLRATLRITLLYEETIPKGASHGAV